MFVDSGYIFFHLFQHITTLSKNVSVHSLLVHESSEAALEHLNQLKHVLSAVIQRLPCRNPDNFASE